MDVRNVWDGLPEAYLKSEIPQADCAAKFLDAHRRIKFPLHYDGERVTATWIVCEERDPECRKTLQYSAEIDLIRGTVAIYVYDKRKRRYCRGSLSPSDVETIMSVVVGRKAVRLISHTVRVNEDTFVIPMYIGARPTVAVYNRKEGVIRWATSFDAGDAVYMAAPNASLGVLPSALEDRLTSETLQRLAKIVERIGQYGPDVTVLSLLPYLHPHSKKRHVPVLVGPMRGGKTVTASFAFDHWPRPKYFTSMTSFAGLRNMLALHHVLADDVGEDPNTMFTWRIVIPYFERAGVPRGNPLDPKRYTTVYMRGALLISTNNPADDIRSVQDRVRYFYPSERVLRERPSGEPHPELAWLAVCPALFKVLPPWLSALDEGYASLLDVGQRLGIWPQSLRPPDPPSFEPNDDPLRAFLYQLYTKLKRLVRRAEDSLRETYRGDAQPGEEEWARRVEDAVCNLPRRVKWRQHGKDRVYYITLALGRFRNPLYRGVEYTESVTVRVSGDSSSSGMTVTRRAATYSVSHVRQILRIAGLDAHFSVMMFGSNYYVAVPCGRVLEALAALEGALRRYGVRLAEEGEEEELEVPEPA